jgi:hypothetical protein
MENNHALVPCGKKVMNWENPPCSDTFIDRHGNTANVPRTQAPGIQFRTLELNHENEGIVFRVGDVLLHDSVALDWDRWQPNDRGVAPNGKRISDTLASYILKEAIRLNPEQANELGSYRSKITD